MSLDGLAYMPGSAICMMEGCSWQGGSVCVNCGARLRCWCGRFVRADSFDAHLESCEVVARMCEPAEVGGE